MTSYFKNLLGIGNKKVYRSHYHFQITIEGPDNGRVIKEELINRIKIQRYAQFSGNQTLENEFELNDPVYLFIQDLINLYAASWSYEFGKVVGKRYNLKYRRDFGPEDILAAYVVNVRQRRGSLDITFELIIESMVYAGALQSFITQMAEYLEIRFRELNIGPIILKFKKRKTHFQIRGITRRIKWENRILKFLLIFLLIALSFSILYRRQPANGNLDVEQIEELVDERVEKAIKTQKIEKIQSQPQDSMLKKVDSLR